MHLLHVLSYAFCYETLRGLDYDKLVTDNVLNS